MNDKLNYYALSRKGKKSPQNEDSCSVPNKNKKKSDIKNKGFLFTVCDGLGGHRAGEVASSICAKLFKENYYNNTENKEYGELLKDEIRNLNIRIMEVSRDFHDYYGMSTTLVSLLIHNETAYINNVGDSRLYLYSQSKLEQLTEDQSPVWKMYKKGIITKDDIIKHEKKNVISQVIGLEQDIEINSYRISLPEKYIFLLCSDGLTDVTLDKEIEDVISTTTDLKTGVERLYQLSQKNHSLDDVTIILVSNYLE
ncbi:MAG TPA: serine/threonine-protein phosphatase [Candidatus Cloacimonetes bacterium]|nr:serine/threonine-protein phosphatase [Candidatus Cloacimonadota bacterium]